MAEATAITIRQAAPDAEEPSVPFSIEAEHFYAAYLLAHGVFDYDPELSTTHMVVEQGYEIGRPSLIDVEVDIAEGSITEVRVGGQVVIVAEGDLLLG